MRDEAGRFIGVEIEVAQGDGQLEGFCKPSNTAYAWQ